MKFEWDTAVKLVAVERGRLIEMVMIPGTSTEITEFTRGQIHALKWVLNLPAAQVEEESFEMERQEVFGNG